MNSISKGAENRTRHQRPAFFFQNARSAFRSYLQTLELGPSDEVLLPSYVGWSAREGSGVFDPIGELGVGYGFYRMTDRLAIDADDLTLRLLRRRPRLLVLIHFFGFPDQNYERICDIAREHEVPILEDEAHAMLSDVVGGVCGRLGDAAIYSLHKLLPVADGGQLVFNGVSAEATKLLQQGPDAGLPVLNFDLAHVARQRRVNAAYLLEQLQALDLPVTPLFDRIPEGIVPQSLPVLVERGSRDDLYFAMNAAGYGVVSLYHTLIQQISQSEFPDAHRLSRKIMNLPVHQDTCPEELSGLLACLEEQVCRTA